MASGPAIRLFEADPELLECVPAEERAFAIRGAVLPAQRVSPGTWDVASLDAPPWGVLVVDGMLAREVGVAGTTAAELLGGGDVLLAGGSSAQEAMVPIAAVWTVLEPLRLAVLDEHFAPVARRWPAITSHLIQRAERRAGRLAVAQAISHLTRVDTRVLVMLWLLADRWGRVGPDAIVLPLRLTHRTLARLVGARRPSVTTAVTELVRHGLIARRDDGSWLLKGPPPEELERVGIEPILAAPAPPARRERPDSPVAERAHAMAGEVRRLAEAYESQTRQNRQLQAESLRVRERARTLRGEIAARRRLR